MLFRAEANQRRVSRSSKAMRSIELQTLLLLDEELAQSDRYMDAGV